MRLSDRSILALHERTCTWAYAVEWPSRTVQDVTELAFGTTDWLKFSRARSTYLKYDQQALLLDETGPTSPQNALRQETTHIVFFIEFRFAPLECRLGLSACTWLWSLSKMCAKSRREITPMPPRAPIKPQFQAAALCPITRDLIIASCDAVCKALNPFAHRL
jgi:hypothetical protein